MSETIEDIIAELREHSGETLPPWVIFNEDGGLDVTLLVDRIEATIKTLIADRDNWRKQALDEDARANAAQAVTDCNQLKYWRKICAACHEGEPPKDCEYYGEPNGCNSPTYGKHPTCKKSLQVGNAAKMREALEWFWSKRSMLDFCHNNLSAKTWEDWDKVYYFLREFADKVQAALAKPPRNCDRFENETDARAAWNEYCASENLPRSTTTEGAFVPWLFAEAEG